MNTSSLKTHKKGNFIKGIGYGIATVSCWGVMNVTTHDALRSGFLPNDLTMLRYCIAGMICLPWVLVNHSKEQGLLPWLKASVFALLAGPLYGWLVNKGMQLTPLTYASVMVPTFTMLITILLLFSMKIDVSKNQVIGTFVIIFGLYSLISSNSSPSPQSQMGVLAFLLAGFIWSCFTILLKKWELELVPTIFMMNIVSGIVYVPIFLSSEQSELSSIPIEHWAEQIVV
ncbi:DMT family transporter, partial [Vibrio parahaemolyticus]